MDIYRVTRTGRGYRTPEVRYGTKRRATALARQVREDNESRRGLCERISWLTYVPTQILIERVPVGEFTDVTAEFLGED